jgi:hypothetical protein
MSFLDQLPTKLRNAAFRAGDEFAWARGPAIEVIHLLTASCIPIDGIEVWLPTTPGPTIPGPFIYHWPGHNRRSGATLREYVEDANAKAEEYVSSFRWDERDATYTSEIPLFNLTAEL